MDTIIEEYINLDSINEDILFHHNNWSAFQIGLQGVNNEIRESNLGTLKPLMDMNNFELKEVCPDFTVCTEFISKLSYNECRLSQPILRAIEQERKNSEGLNLVKIHHIYNMKKDVA